MLQLLRRLLLPRCCYCCLLLEGLCRGSAALRESVAGASRFVGSPRSARMAAVLKRLSMSKETSPSAAGAGGEAAAAASSLQKSFKEMLSAEAIAFFNEVTQKSFSQQAKAFLSAYWKEVGDQAEFIYTVRRVCCVVGVWS